MFRCLRFVALVIFTAAILPAVSPATLAAQTPVTLMTETGIVFQPGSGEPDDHFGQSVAIHEDTLVIGAPQDTVAGDEFQGSVYVFVRDGDTWTQQQRLIRSGGGPGEFFGSAVDIRGNRIIVGAPFTKVGSKFWAGAFSIWERTGTTWAMVHEQLGTQEGQFLGIKVAITLDTAFAGAPGTDIGSINGQGQVQTAVRQNGTWTAGTTITATDGAKEDRFGVAVAARGSTLVVGANGVNVSVVNQGAAYVYTETGLDQWTATAKLTASNAAELDAFGEDVAVHENTIVVGAREAGDRGAAYVFTTDGSTWTERHVLLPEADIDANDHFGVNVAVGDNWIAVSAPRQSNERGRVALYRRNGDTWSYRHSLSGRNDGDRFGAGVAISGKQMVVGAPAVDDTSHDPPNQDEGTAYLFESAPVSVDAGPDQHLASGPFATASVTLSASVSALADLMQWTVNGTILSQSTSASLTLPLGSHHATFTAVVSGETFQDDVAITISLPTTVGLTGPTGLQGPKGDTGDPGRDGEDGIDGKDGRDGTDGVNGTNGVDGITLIALIEPAGPNCASGGQKLTPTRSDATAAGPPSYVCNGTNGANGASGATGPQGASGKNGQDGNDGQDGADGTDGAPGAMGPKGPAGDAGIDGKNGADGAPGDAGPKGANGDPGRDGADGAPGPIGAPGPAGPQGLAGPTGPDTDIVGSLLLMMEGQAPPPGYIFVGTFVEERIDEDGPGGNRPRRLPLTIWQKQ